MDILILVALFVYLTAFFVFFTVQFFNLLFRGFAPFYSTKARVIKAIVDGLEIKEEDVVVELGCGKAGFLEAVHKKLPKVKLIGYEYSFVPYLIARIQNVLKKNNLEIKNENFFKVDLSNADIIYCYLSIRTMKQLEDKFIKECKKGTRIVSYMFPMVKTKPTKVQDVAKGEKVYYYTIE